MTSILHSVELASTLLRTRYQDYIGQHLETLGVGVRQRGQQPQVTLALNRL